jgi:hypothetical protein
MIDWTLTVILSSVVLGSMSYMAVWGMHNFEITVDTIMAWADRQESFLQKMISCPICFGVQMTLALTSMHCLVFGLGLWSWVSISLLGSLTALLMTRLDPLTDRK